MSFDRIPERKPRTFAEAGTVSVTVVSHTRWENFVNDLSTSFSLSDEDALKLAAQSTSLVNEQRISALDLVLKAAMEQTSTTRTTEAGSKTSDLTTTTTTPGDLGKAPAVGATTGSVPASAASVFAGKIGVQPVLLYQLAAAIRQEVTLLNRYLRSAASMKDYEPFIVRLDVASQQKGRNTPVDLDLDIAFLLGGTDQSKGVIAVPLLVNDSMEVSTASVARQNLFTLGAALSALPSNNALGASLGLRRELLMQSLGSEFNPLMTVSRSTASQSAISVHIGAMAKATDQFEHVSRVHRVTVMLLVPVTERSTAVSDFQRRCSKDGATVVDQIAQRSLFVAKPLGSAASAPTSGCDLDDISAKLNLEPRSVRFVSRARFTDTRTGDVLAGGNEATDVAKSDHAKRLLESWARRHAKVAIMPEQAWASFKRNDPDGFRLAMACLSDDNWHTAWADLVALGRDDSSSQGTFELAPWPPAVWPARGQSAYAVLTGEAPPFGLEVRLEGGQYLSPRSVARGCLAGEAASPDHKPLTGNQESFPCEKEGSIMATELEVSDARADRNSVKLKFPARFSVKETDRSLQVYQGNSGKASPGAICLEPDKTLDAPYWSAVLSPRCWAVGPAMPAATKKPERRLVGSVQIPGTTVLATREGHGTLVVNVEIPANADAAKKPDEVRVRLSGAAVTEAKPLGGDVGCALWNGTLIVKSTCSVQLQLANAVPDTELSVTATAYKKGSKSPTDDVDEPIKADPAAVAIKAMAKAEPNASTVEAKVTIQKPASKAPEPKKK